MRQPRTQADTLGDTLSIRLPEALISRIRSVQECFRGRWKGDGESLSEVARHMLESCSDQRLEMIELLRTPTQTLVAMDRHRRAGGRLTGAQWGVLVHYARYGAEDYHERPVVEPNGKIYAALMRAFVRLARAAGPALTTADLGYLAGNLRAWSDASEGNIITIAERAAGELLARPSEGKAVFVCRNLEAVLDSAASQGMDAVDDALAPEYEVLFRLASRGHCLVHHAPVREANDDASAAITHFTTQEENGVSVSGFCWDGELHVGVTLKRNEVVYPMCGFPSISEFRLMLAASQGCWDGACWFATRWADGGSFRSKRAAVEVTLTETEWQGVAVGLARMFGSGKGAAFSARSGREYGDCREWVPATDGTDAPFARPVAELSF